MKVIIAGGRDCIEYNLLLDAIEQSKFEITEVIGGGAKGADELGMIWATNNDIKFTKFPADWNKNGNAAGPIRNRQMAGYGEALIALWDGKSRGTKNMIEEATKKNLKVFIKEYKKD